MGKFKSGKELGELIKMHREEVGMSVRELSNRVDGVSMYYFSQLERGQSKKNPNFEAIIQAFRILGLRDEEINNYIPLDEYEAEKLKWLEDRVQSIREMAKNLPTEHRQKLVKLIQKDARALDKIHLRINKG